MQSYVVTGANKGIGLAIVRRILIDIPNSFVFLGSRDIARGDDAVKLLISENPKWTSRIKVMQIDVASKDSIIKSAKHVATELKAAKMPLVGLVNNAGMIGTFQECFNVNVVGVYLTTNAFLPLLSKGKDNYRSRIVHISSGLGPNFVQKCNEKWVDFFVDKENNLTWEQLEEVMTAVIDNPEAKLKEMGIPKADVTDIIKYQISKAALNLLTLIQAREHPEVMINSVAPGFIRTDMAVSIFGKDIKAKTPDEGAASCMYVLTAKELKGNGYYYGSDSKRSPLHKYRDPKEPEYEGER